MKQPELMNEWGVPFYGRAETVTGGLWWYTDAEGVRRALLPQHPSTTPPQTGEQK